jgi:hypothetical protein
MSHNLPQNILLDMSEKRPVFHFLDLVRIMFYKVSSSDRPPCVKPQPAGPGLCIYVHQRQGGRVIPQALGSLFVTFYDW